MLQGFPNTVIIDFLLVPVLNEHTSHGSNMNANRPKNIYFVYCTYNAVVNYFLNKLSPTP